VNAKGGCGYFARMTKIELNIADDLASQAKEAGLLKQAKFEALLAEESRRQAFVRFRKTAAKIHGAKISEMSMDEVCEMVREIRRERRGPVQRSAGADREALNLISQS
jgi:hypothetical protein